MRTRLLMPLVLLAAAGSLLPGCYEPEESGRIWIGTEVADSAIVGGHTTTGWDSVVMLYAGGGVCTGTVVAPDVILTAAHCLDGVVGALDVFWCDECIQGGYLYYEYNRTSNDYHQHNQYNPNTMVGDIGVIVLNGHSPTDPYGINRTAPSNNGGNWVHDPLTFVGFGVTHYYSDDSGVKREVDMTISEYDGTFLYYYSSNQQTCFGDSGGPAFSNHTGTWRTVGVTSYGDEHCNSYGADIRVDHYESWIDGYTGGWDPDDDDDDAADDDDDNVGDDDDNVGDDDDNVGDDDDNVGDDDQVGDDDFTPPDPDELPDPRTNNEYGQPSGFSCVGNQGASDAAPFSAVLLLLAGAGFLLRRR